MTQTLYATKRAHLLSERRSISSALKTVHRQLQARVSERRKRRRLVTLLNCDDAILNDIGHTRAELEMALKLPYSVNADDELKQWREWRVITG